MITQEDVEKLMKGIGPVIKEYVSKRLEEHLPANNIELLFDENQTLYRYKWTSKQALQNTTADLSRRV